MLAGCAAPGAPVPRQPLDGRSEDTAAFDSGSGGDGRPTADGPYAFDEGVLEPPFQHAGAVWAGVALLDYDDDGWLDIFLTNGVGLPDALYRNLGDGTFLDVAAEAGVDSRRASGSVVAGDLDDDGDVDLVVGDACSTGSRAADGGPVYDGGKHIWLNQGDGTFAAGAFDVPAELAPALAQCTVSLTLGDFDEDGVLDLAQLDNVDPDTEPPWDFEKFSYGAYDMLWYGDGRGGFDAGAPLRDLGSFVAASFDATGDGHLDLVVGHSGAGIYVQRRDPNRGPRDRTIDEMAVQSGQGLWMGLAVADLDGDGTLDLYATNEGLSPFMHGYDNRIELTPGAIHPFHSVLLGDGGGRYQRPAAWPVQAPQVLAGDLYEGMDGRNAADTALMDWVGPEDLARYPWGWGVVPLDVDADGWTDIAWVGNNCTAPLDIIWDEARGAGPGALLINDGGTGFIDETASSGMANVDAAGRAVDGRGIATGDLNNDGYPDLVIANRTYNPALSDPLAQEPGGARVLLSRPRAGNWLQVRLVGQAPRDPVGAVVRVDTGARQLVFPYAAGGATGSSSEHMVSIGLGPAEAVDVEVTFPGGGVLRRAGVAANQRIELTEGT